MDYNIAIIFLGGVIVVVTLILIYKDSNKDQEDFPSQLITGLRDQQNYNPQEMLNQEKIIKGLELLNGEIASIKDQIERLSALGDDDSQRMELSPSSKNEWENFDHSLNFNLFIQKNSEIINLHEKGKSYEEIAKILNKSIREVEMVVKLAK